MQGNLRKMLSNLAKPVQYQLPLSAEHIELNTLIGESIKLNYTGNIACVHCGRKTNKSFNQGYCYPCFITLAQCDMCIMKPEQCHYHQGTCREPNWGEEHCLQDHFVYLANTSGVKVGITRHTQIPTRWIDQGATQALPIFKVKSRYISGLIEVALAQHVSDKTNWQKLLKGSPDKVNLATQRDKLLQICKQELKKITANAGKDGIWALPNQTTVNIFYPVVNYPTKVKSLNFDKTPAIEGKLVGIKGQYLLLDTGVINIRKFGGYEVKFAVSAC